MSNIPVSLPNAILTTSQLFGTGAALEQLRDHHLIFNADGRQEIAPVITYDGKTYAAASLPEAMQQALHLPTHAEDFGTVASLTSSIADFLVTYNVDADTSWLLATYVLSTWVCDCVPSFPVLNLWGTIGTESTLVEILGCLCRRPLRMLSPSLRELTKVPADLCPTLLLKNPKANALADLLAAAGQSGLGLFHGGEFLRVNCAVIVTSDQPISCAALHLPLLTAAASYHRIHGAEAEEIANRFQPRLLAYRLQHHLEVMRSRFDCDRFAPGARLLARIFGAALEGDGESQARLIDLLSRFDEDHKVAQSQSAAAIVLEAMLTVCHEGQTSAKTGDVADLANGIMAARGERANLTARAAGDLMRDLGFCAKRKGTGYHVELTNSTSDKIHRLAAVYGVLSMVDVVVDCELCRMYGGKTEKGNHGQQ